MGKKLTDDILKWTLDINGKPAMKELNALEQSTRKLENTNKDLRLEMQKLEARGKKNTQEYKDLAGQMKKNNLVIAANKSKMAALRKELGVNSLTTRQLRSEYRRLKNQMDNMTPGTKEWKKLDRELKAVTHRMDELRGKGGLANKMFGQFKDLLPALGIGALITMIGKLGKEFMNLSIRLEGDNRRASIVFGKSLDYVKEKANELSKAMGVTTNEFVASAAATGDLLIPLGFARDQAAKMSVQLQSLAGALDEWTGGRLGAAQVSEILTKAMLGENEQLKQLGIAIRMDSKEYKDLVKEKLAHGAATQAQAQAMATLDLIFKKSKDAQTAYTQDGNKLLRFQKSVTRWWRQMKENVVLYFSENSVDKLKSEQREVWTLSSKLTDLNTSEEERVKILDRLKIISPDIVKGLDSESINTKKLQKNLAKYNETLVKRIMLETMSEEKRKLANKLAETQLEKAQELDKANQYLAKYFPEIATQAITLNEKLKKAGESAMKMHSNIAVGTNAYMNEIRKLQNNIQNLTNDENSLNKEYGSTSDKLERLKTILGLNNDATTTSTDGTGKAERANKTLGEAIKEVTGKIEALQKARLKLLPTDEKGLSNNEKQILQLQKIKKQLTDLRDLVHNVKPREKKFIDSILSKEDVAAINQNVETINDSINLVLDNIAHHDNIDNQYGGDGEAKGAFWKALGLNDNASTVEKLSAIKDLTFQAFNDINQIITNAEQQQFEKFKRTQDKKRAKLDADLKAGRISYEQYTASISQLDTELDKKKRKLEHDAAVRQKALNLANAITGTALAIISAMTTLPFPADIIAAGIVGAMGALQIGVIATTPVPQMAKGNYAQVIGADDGKKYNARITDSRHPSGLYSEPTYVPGFGLFGETALPEMVFNPEDTAKLLRQPALIDAINTTLGIRQFADGNAREIIRETTTQTFTDPALMEMLQKLSDKLDEPSRAVLVADEDYIRTHEQVKNDYDAFQQRVSM